MKNIKLAVLSVAALFVGALRTSFSTANAAKAPDAPDSTSEIADLAAKFDALQKQNADFQATITGLQAQLAQQKAVAAAPLDPLGLGALKLPAGIDPKDVLWRKSAGLTLQQAVQAAVQQQSHDKARATAAANAAKNKRG